MRNWNLTVSLHWPHDRFALGWEYLRPTEEVKFHTTEIFLLMITITFNLESNN